MIFIAVITAFLAHRFAFLISSIAAFLAFLCIAVGAAIWTAIIERTKSINSTTVAGGTDLGITVSYGNALWICVSLLLTIGRGIFKLTCLFCNSGAQQLHACFPFFPSSLPAA